MQDSEFVTLSTLFGYVTLSTLFGYVLSCKWN